MRNRKKPILEDGCPSINFCKINGLYHLARWKSVESLVSMVLVRNDTFVWIWNEKTKNWNIVETKNSRYNEWGTLFFFLYSHAFGGTFHANKKASLGRTSDIHPWCLARQMAHHITTTHSRIFFFFRIQWLCMCFSLSFYFFPVIFHMWDIHIHNGILKYRWLVVDSLKAHQRPARYTYVGSLFWWSRPLIWYPTVSTPNIINILGFRNPIKKTFLEWSVHSNAIIPAALGLDHWIMGPICVEDRINLVRQTQWLYIFFTWGWGSDFCPID